MDEGTAVKWVGVQNPHSAPGYNGVVVKTAHHDPDSVKVDWEERPDWLPGYTWERRKNLEIT